MQDPEKYKEYDRRSYWKDPEKARIKTREGNLKSKYGLTIEGYDRMWVQQREACAACGAKEPRGSRWNVDHCHESGEVRGIICMHCNAALGMAADSTDILLDLVNYLKRSKLVAPK